MTVRESETLVRKETIINEYWKKYCSTRSPWFYRKWQETKKSYRQYKDKLAEKYSGQQLTF